MRLSCWTPSYLHTNKEQIPNALRHFIMQLNNVKAMGFVFLYPESNHLFLQLGKVLIIFCFPKEPSSRYGCKPIFVNRVQKLFNSYVKELWKMDRQFFFFFNFLFHLLQDSTKERKKRNISFKAFFKILNHD